MTGKASPEFKRCFAAYRKALEGGAHPDVLQGLWDAVMRALHGTPEPPCWIPPIPKNLNDEWAESVTFAGIPLTKATPDATFALFAAPAAPLSIDDDFDRMMREG